MRAVVEQVVQTATRVLEGQLAPREAVTILASMTSEAVPAARRLRHDRPEQADAYRELLDVVERELRGREGASDDRRHLRAVIEDVAAVRRALG